MKRFLSKRVLSPFVISVLLMLFSCSIHQTYDGTYTGAQVDAGTDTYTHSISITVLNGAVTAFEGKTYMTADPSNVLVHVIYNSEGTEPVYVKKDTGWFDNKDIAVDGKRFQGNFVIEELKLLKCEYWDEFGELKITGVVRDLLVSPVVGG